ncbi:MAG: Flp pilus assembly complex ATPase component TadA [Clostridia bacterium]|nr:Flp pilus assembly complex ATPase component TadA [Clostridia bacterium]
MLRYLPSRILKALKHVNFNNVYELRLRQNKPISINENGKLYYINTLVTHEEIEEIVYNLCKKSIYSFEEQIKRGYVTTENGIRVGLSGEFVINNNSVQTIKNFTSLSIRFPHQIMNFASKFVNEIYNDGSVLVISKSGVGKTTFIRDFSRCLNKKKNINTIIIDERNEIASFNDSFSFDVGTNVDVLTYCNKNFGFNQAIRTLNPDVIITDELMSVEDINGVIMAILSGVNVTATIHAKSLSDALNKDFMRGAINLFNYYVLIENTGSNRILTIFDGKGKEICKY